MSKSLRPDRANTVLVGTHIPSDIARDFQLFSRVEGKTGASLLKEYVEDRVRTWRTDQSLAVIGQRRKEAAERDSSPSP